MPRLVKVENLNYIFLVKVSQKQVYKDALGDPIPDPDDPTKDRYSDDAVITFLDTLSKTHHPGEDGRGFWHYFGERLLQVVFLAQSNSRVESLSENRFRSLKTCKNECYVLSGMWKVISIWNSSF